jgi:hypothetical protein
MDRRAPDQRKNKIGQKILDQIEKGCNIQINVTMYLLLNYFQHSTAEIWSLSVEFLPLAGA